MQSLNRVLTVAVTAGAVSLLSLPALAHVQADISRHRHYLEVGTTLIEVGPALCDDATLQQAFNEFHAHVHLGEPGRDAFDHEHTPRIVTNRGLSTDPCADLSSRTAR